MIALVLQKTDKADESLKCRSTCSSLKMFFVSPKTCQYTVFTLRAEQRM